MKKVIIHIIVSEYEHIFHTAVLSSERGLLVLQTYKSLTELWIEHKDYNDAQIINIKY